MRRSRKIADSSSAEAVRLNGATSAKRDATPARPERHRCPHRGSGSQCWLVAGHDGPHRWTSTPETRELWGARAPRGSVPATLLLKLPAALDAAAREAARAEGISLAEWWRRAGRDAVLRAEARRRGLL